MVTATLAALACSCGTADDHVVAHRSTADGKHVCLWSDGSLTWALGRSITGAWFQPRPERRAVALAAGWLTLGEVEIYNAADVPALTRAARWTAERDGLPGTVRKRAAALLTPRTLVPTWTVYDRDRDGKPRERVWRLPRMGPWVGHVVWDFCTRAPRYELFARVGTGGTARDTVGTTGIRFANQPELLAWLEANAPREAESPTPIAAGPHTIRHTSDGTTIAGEIETPAKLDDEPEAEPPRPKCSDRELPLERVANQYAWRGPLTRHHQPPADLEIL